MSTSLLSALPLDGYESGLVCYYFSLLASSVLKEHMG